MIIMRTVRRMLAMCPAAWSIYIRTLQLSCLLLLLAVILLIACDGRVGENYTLYMTAMGLYETPQALLLISAIGSVCVEELSQ